jgi:hypothetical protein
MLNRPFGAGRNEKQHVGIPDVLRRANSVRQQLVRNTYKFGRRVDGSQLFDNIE